MVEQTIEDQMRWFCGWAIKTATKTAEGQAAEAANLNFRFRRKSVKGVRTEQNMKLRQIKTFPSRHGASFVLLIIRQENEKFGSPP